METKEKVATEKQERKAKNKPITFKVNKKGKHVSHVLNLFRCTLIPFYRLIRPFKVFGNKNVQDGPLLYVSNHYTAVDAAFPAVTTKEGIHFLAKKESKTMPVIGPCMVGLKSIFANRDGNDVRAIMDCLKCLKAGDKLAIYPEGTRNRNPDVEMLPFHHGASLIAIKAQVKIVPLVIYKKPRNFRMTHILVGEPFELTEYYGKKKLSEEELTAADEKIRSRMLDLRREHSEYLAAKKNRKNK